MTADCPLLFIDEFDGIYRSLTTRPYGTPVELPAPVGFTLETEKLKKFAQ